MSLFGAKVDISDFSIETIDLSVIEGIRDILPSGGTFDLNTCEKGLILTLEGQNFCQEKIAKIDRWISYKESEKNKAWAIAAIDKSAKAGVKTAKEKEWFAQADEDFIKACDDLTVAKACRKWFENKADYFSGWHYSFKTFLKRDYGLEKIADVRFESPYNGQYPGRVRPDPEEVNWGGDDINWEKS